MINDKRVLILIILVSISFVLISSIPKSSGSGLAINGGGGGQTGGTGLPGRITCYPAGTKIRMADGTLKNIEDVEVGEKVLSYNPQKNEYVVTEVTQLHSPVREGVYNINNGLIKPTRDHPIYVKKEDGRKGWAAIDPQMGERVYDLSTELMKLEVGDKIYKKGEWVEVESMEYEEGPIQTYTFNVDAKDLSENNYFANGVLSHNRCELSKIPEPSTQPYLSDDGNVLILPSGERIPITAETLQQGYVETKDGDIIRIRNLQKTGEKTVDGKTYEIYRTGTGKKIACKGDNCPGDTRPRDLEDRSFKPSTSSTTTTTCPPSPTITSFEINNNDQYTSSKNVNLETQTQNTDECRFKNNGNSWSSWSSSYSSKSWTLTSGDESKTVRVQCRETTCNKKDSNSDSIILDTTPPTVYALYYPAVVTTNDTVTYEVNASDKYSGLKNIKIYVDGSLKKTCSSSPCEYTEGPYSNGSTHSYYAVVEDNIGNTGRTQGDSFEVFRQNVTPMDHTPPKGNITHFPPAVTDSDKVTYNVIATDPFTGVRTIKIYVDGQLKEKCPSSPCNYTEGPYVTGTNHTYYTKIWDAVGNMFRDPAMGVKSFVVGCTGVKCLDLTVKDDTVHIENLKPEIVEVEIRSGSVNMETTELYVEGWRGDYEFLEKSCSGCSLSGSHKHKDREIKVSIRSGRVKNVKLKIFPHDNQRPGRYEFKIKNR